MLPAAGAHPASPHNGIFTLDDPSSVYSAGVCPTAAVVAYRTPPVLLPPDQSSVTGNPPFVVVGWCGCGCDAPGEHGPPGPRAGGRAARARAAS
ncbi:hypothetical protein FMEAI12_2670025 [Parafrankia sp. Ea1.12]|nr:hypothetical protein FMEAI12_2670025 [Parafrankia sp. Ea1.12]